MLKLPKKFELSREIRSLLDCPNCRKLLTVPQEKGTDFTCSVPELTCEDGSLILGLENEHSELGRGLVRALWFGQDVRLWLVHGETRLILSLTPWRCHIAGPLFTRILCRARQAEPEADYTAVWELYPQRAEQSDTLPPAPQAIQITVADQHHLDHRSLHR